MPIANIPIALVVDGQRKVIPAGAEIPAGLSDHDTQALLASGALLDAQAAAAAKADADAAKKQADAQFQAARRAAQAAAISIQTGATDQSADAAVHAGAKATDKPNAPVKPRK